MKALSFLAALAYNISRSMRKEVPAGMKQAAKHNTELILHGSLVRAILSIAVPVVINAFIQTLYNLTDTYWLGQIGKEPLAAINLVSPVQSIVLSFGSGVTVAGAVMIAQYIGARKEQDAKKIANQIIGLLNPADITRFKNLPAVGTGDLIQEPRDMLGSVFCCCHR